jgi:tetratricopeptide (TPR) repeat protein
MAIVEGMFGGFMPSYDEALAGLMKQRQASNASKTQGLGPYAGITQVGLEQAQQMGDFAGKALGYEQPELAKAKQRDQAWNEAISSVQNQSDPEEVYTALAKTFQKYGLTKEALQAATKASEAKAEKAKQTRSEKELSMREKEFGMREEEFKYKKGKKTFQQVTQYTGENDEALSFDPDTGKYYHKGKEYTGNLKPKPSAGNPFSQFIRKDGSTGAATPPATRKEYNPKTGKIEEVPIK